MFGTAGAFWVAVGVVAIWALTGPLFNFSDTWQAAGHQYRHVCVAHNHFYTATSLHDFFLCHGFDVDLQERTFDLLAARGSASWIDE